MKAQEANKIAIDYLMESSKLSYSTIINRIKEASSKGRFSITIYDRVNKIVINKLKKDGYILDEYSPQMPPRDGYFLTVKW